jgi:Fe-S cluster biogenesis protein NfuA
MVEDQPTALGGREIEERLRRLDELLGRLEQIPGQTSAMALEAAEALADVYGEALRRVVDRVGPSPAAEALAGDELVGHLLVLHGIHPVPLEQRLDDALDRIRPYVHSHGGRVDFIGVEDGIARVRFSGTCDGCTASSATLELGVREALLAAAPELAGVEAEDGGGAAHPPPADPTPRLIPLEALRRPAATGGRA